MDLNDGEASRSEGALCRSLSACISAVIKFGVGAGEVPFLDCITIVSACNGELMSNSFAFAMKNAMCSEASCFNQGHLQDFIAS